MTKVPAVSDGSSRITYEDVAAMPEDGNRYEVLDGELLVTAAPSPYHQRVSKRLQRQLEAYFEDGGRGEVFDAPIDLLFGPHDAFQPDLVVVGDPATITRRGIMGAPLIAVEVLSPSTRRRDRTAKFDRYATLGVPHYWIVDPDDQTIECFRLANGAFQSVLQAGATAAVQHPDFNGLALDMADVWSRPAGF